jgi:hypothetical protein
MRTPLSRQRNKHIQSCLVEAAKLAPRYDHDLALVYENEKKKGNANRATLAVARKMVAYWMSGSAKAGTTAERHTCELRT